MAWVVWVVITVLLAVGELVTPGLFFLGPVAVGGLVTTIVAAAGASVAAQLIVFILGSLASLAVLRPIARAHLHMPVLVRTGAAALEGRKALVLQRVDANSGLVRIGGEEWSARTYLDDQVIEPGVRVEVVKIEGATALVME